MAGFNRQYLEFPVAIQHGHSLSQKNDGLGNDEIPFLIKPGEHQDGISVLCSGKGGRYAREHLPATYPQGSCPNAGTGEKGNRKESEKVFHVA